MTFQEIVDSVSERTNLTATDTLARIGRNINDRYRRLTSSVGLQTSRRATDTQSTVIGDPSVTFDLEKLEIVYVLADGKRRVLDERTYDEWRDTDTWVPRTGVPQWFAVRDAGASSITIVLSHTPTEVFEIKADGMAAASTLSGSQVPAFPADFHDALVFGAMADEYAKMEKPGPAGLFEKQYEERVSELRYFLAKSVYLKQFQQSNTSFNRSPYRRTFRDY